MKNDLFNSLKEKILNKKIVLFGEVHGTKETPRILADFLKKYSLIKDFELCLELPINEQENITNFIKKGKAEYLNLSSLEPTDGRKSLEMIELIKTIRFLNKKINCIDINYETEIENIKERDKIMANNILNIKNKQVLVLLGNFHATKINIKINNINYETTGSIIKKELKNDLFTVNLMPLSGKHFHNEIKNVENGDVQNFYDYNFSIETVTPCTF